ncbi:MAG: metal-sensing transcriptional repressor [Velocimicrobium sp.]
MEEKCECVRHKHREQAEYKDLITRLNRIEGQVRGIKGMVENEAYCVDILTQVSAIQSALNGFNKVLLGNHIRTCVVKDIRDGNDEVVDELVKTFVRLMK